MIIDVFCPTLLVDGTQAGRFFDNAADDYRNAPAAGVLLAAAGHIVRAHGGRADVKRLSASGATITYVFPQTP
jgi:signal transduction histidine kinase